MSTVVGSVVRGGLGPRRLRDGLRRATAPLRASAGDSLGGTTRVGVRIPPSILGAELADAMGDALRKALRFWDESPADEGTPESAGGRAPTLFTGHPEKDGARVRVPAMSMPGSGANDVDFASRAAATSAGRRGLLPEGPGVSDPILRRAHGHSASMAGRKGSRSGSPEREARLPRAREAAATPMTDSGAAPTASPLASALRTYWSRSSAQQSGSPDSVAPPGSNRVADEGRNAGISAPTRTSDGSHRGARVAGQLASVHPHSSSGGASIGMTSPLAADRWAAAGSPTSPTPASPRALLSMQPAPTPDWLLGDLADQLADILREQAIDQGVDLT